MGMKLKYIAFKDLSGLSKVVSKLYTNDKYEDFKSAYQVKKLCDELNQEVKTYIQLRKDLEKKNLAEEDLEKEIDTLHALEIDLKWGPLTPDDVKHLKFSPYEIAVLEGIVPESVLDSI